MTQLTQEERQRFVNELKSLGLAVKYTNQTIPKYEKTTKHMANLITRLINEPE